MKKLIRKLLNKFGYDIVKTRKDYHGDANKLYHVKVGTFILTMPGNNPLVKHYEHFPNYNIELGNLAGIIAKKYPDCSMLDIGANVGDTIAVVKSVINIPIIAIEGDEFTYKFLQKNSPLFEHLYTINQFLGEESKDQIASTIKEGWNTTIIPNSTNDGTGKLIKLKSLDEVLITHELFSRNLKLLKIDAEGFDTIILRGATAAISRHNPVLYFEYNRENMDIIEEDGLSTLFSLVKYGYDKIAILDNHNRCLIHTSLAEKDIIKQLHNYADGMNGLIPHYDICIFHSHDSDILGEFLNSSLKNK